MIDFYKCKHCGNIVIFLENSGVVPNCCGEPMEKIKAGSVDGSLEKHVPKVIINGCNMIVNVGEIDHPMERDHYIQWVVLETNKGIHVSYLKAGDKPQVEFTLAKGESMVAVYEHCNIHGLWMNGGKRDEMD